MYTHITVGVIHYTNTPQNEIQDNERLCATLSVLPAANWSCVYMLHHYLMCIRGISACEYVFVIFPHWVLGVTNTYGPPTGLHLSHHASLFSPCSSPITLCFQAFAKQLEDISFNLCELLLGANKRKLSPVVLSQGAFLHFSTFF